MTTRSFPGSQDPDADRLNTLLDAIRSGARIPETSTTHTEAADLATTADAFRTLDRRGRIAAEATDTTFDSIWEDMMGAHATTAMTPFAGAATGRSTEINHRVQPVPPPVKISRWQSFLSAAMVALVIAGLVSVAWNLRGTGNEGGDDQGERARLAATGLDGTLQASPSADESWMAWVTPEECVAEPMSQEEYAAILSEVPDTANRSYTVAGPTEPRSAQEAVAAARGYEACADFRMEDQRRGAETDAHIFYRNPNMNWPFSDSVYRAEQLEKSRQVSAQLQALTADDFMIVTENEPPEDLMEKWGINSSDDTTLASSMVYNPASAVVLEDGRVLIPQTEMWWSSTSLFPGLFATPPTDQYVSGWVTVLEDVDGEWKVDERLEVCIGECDGFWAERDQFAAPPATPEASPAAEVDWLAWFSHEECVVEPMTTEEYADIMRNEPPESVISSRSYTVVGPADPDTANAVARAGREHGACGFYREIDQKRALESPAFIYIDNAGATSYQNADERKTQDVGHGEELSSQVPVQDPEHYIAVTTSDPDELPVPTGALGMAFEPENALLLDDGRVAIPGTKLFASDPEDPFLPGGITIFSNESGEWLVDEMLPFCVGDCETFWMQSGGGRVVYDGTPAATPMATPKG